MYIIFLEISTREKKIYKFITHIKNIPFAASPLLVSDQNQIQLDTPAPFRYLHRHEKRTVLILVISTQPK